jgi:hypothetical protein
MIILIALGPTLAAKRSDPHKHGYSQNPSLFLEGVYEAAVLEANDSRLEERIGVAEEALMARLLDLTDGQKHAVELRAVEDALKSLRGLKRERLGL